MSHLPDLPEPGQHNLRRALLNLPRHHPDEALWARIEYYLAGEYNLRRAILSLPRHDADAALWLRIESWLQSEQNLRRAILGLPLHQPAEELWLRIQAHLAGDEPLRRALLALPVHTPPEQLWALIEDHLSGQQHLQRALHELPRHEPDEALWHGIQGQLGGERALDRAATFLPAHEPDDDLWGAIAARLDEAAPAAAPLTVAADTDTVAAPAATHAAPAPALRRLWTSHMWQVAASAAAAVVLVALVWWQRGAAPAQPSVAQVEVAAPGGARETISYSEEVVTMPAEPQPSYASFDALETQGVSFIDAHCTSLPTVCRSTEFRDLRNQLTELEAEEKRLQQDARRFGNTPELVQDQVRVTTLKATVTRELIQMLIS
ncbi:hypothetical protein EJV47_09270 [Hymenobacter gummosus]|uniref:Uncharacterized protein n=1 Tax=Hymenobacter gummosus TaxID=1776032 RepID=A0A3S0H699_9BACT|nr:hypothetical protein [Hymenobacter gummosus]RTQ50800.1 hypothetical protein EJV47_09270 [Hymenobacter gummosus]